MIELIGLVAVYDPELLRTFLAVAQSLSFTRAGTGLNLCQPTVSQHVRRLEQAVGRPLFVRDTRSVTLTADGEAMAPNGVDFERPPGPVCRALREPGRQRAQSQPRSSAMRTASARLRAPVLAIAADR